ncbi:MAG: site-specific DNA-methyltransferase [Acidobacteriota bacterium]|nr:site-specific DNA-methyltransferase [Acidobacteriota bacterium]
MPKKSVDLLVTDPPYGDNVSYGPRNVRISGNKDPLISLLVLSESYRVLKPNTTAYVFCGMRHVTLLRSYFAQYTRYKVREVIIWNKVSMGVGFPFRKQYECILVLEKGSPKYRNHRMLNLLNFRRVSNPTHPHVKPLDLIKALILHSSNEGQLVLDPFVGSGTTPLAAKILGRDYVGIEIDPKYCRLAEERVKQGCQRPLWSDGE